MTVLVTGATGFVGRAVCLRLAKAGIPVRPAGRAEIGDLAQPIDWAPHLDGATAVVHLAARVHVMRDDAADPLAAFRRINRDATALLAAAATQAGVSRFVFMSSVKAMGEGRDAPYTAADTPAPADPYGISKWEAEKALKGIALGRMDAVVLRPPLVYGPRVGGNFHTLLRSVDRGVPLPFGAVRNRRSLISVGNLADAVAWALQAPPGTYLPSDRRDLSTPVLIRAVAAALGRPARLIAVPPAWLRAAGTLLGRRAAIDRLLGSLTVDGALPGWTPAETPAEALAATAAWYRGARRGTAAALA